VRFLSDGRNRSEKLKEQSTITAFLLLKRIFAAVSLQ
jgi:hypothetical protein